jgi:hypothetical protein
VLSKTTKNLLQINSVGQKLSTVWGNFSQGARTPCTQRDIAFSQLAVKGLIKVSHTLTDLKNSLQFTYQRTLYIFCDFSGQQGDRSNAKKLLIWLQKWHKNRAAGTKPAGRHKYLIVCESVCMAIELTCLEGALMVTEEVTSLL